MLKWQDASGIDKKKFVNVNGKKYKESGLKETIDSLSNEALFGELAKDGMLVKRPILIDSQRVLIGFKIKEWEEALLG